MRSIKPTNQDRLNNAKSADSSNFWKSSHYLALREQVEKILANIAPTSKRQSDAD